VTLARVQTLVTYSSSGGGETYYFDVVIDAQGLVSVKNVRGPTGAPCATGLPDIVLDDMQEAKGITALLVGETEAASGTLTCVGQTEITEPVVPGTLNNTEYRVLYTPPDAVQFRTEDKTTTSFKAVVGVAYGSGSDPKLVPYSVLVATAQASTTGGTVTFVVADNSQKAIVFATALPTADYRVLLSPNGFFTARAIDKAKTGFTIELGHTLQGAETVTVGYDVFV
jgi:hypothetical protein